jgi:hypothetical protein
MPYFWVKTNIAERTVMMIIFLTKCLADHLVQENTLSSPT